MKNKMLNSTKSSFHGALESHCRGQAQKPAVNSFPLQLTLTGFQCKFIWPVFSCFTTISLLLFLLAFTGIARLIFHFSYISLCPLCLVPTILVICNQNAWSLLLLISHSDKMQGSRPFIFFCPSCLIEVKMARRTYLLHFPSFSWP